MIPSRPRIPFERNPIIGWAVVLAVLIVLVDTVIAVPYLGAENTVVDFDAFYIVSQFILEGRLAEAYDPAVMMDRQTELAGHPIFMPWTYPPPFNLVIAPLSFAPRGVAYGLFTLLGLAFYLSVLRRVAGAYLPGVLMAIAPALIMVVLVGQSALIVATLIGLVALFWLQDRRNMAGLALGLLVLKPHLALGVGFLVLVRGQWRILAVAVAMVVLLAIPASIAFGFDIWAVFLTATRLASENMEAGLYPLFRMTSLYALLFTLGVPPSIALGLHGIGALLALGSILVALWLGWPLRRLLGVAVLAGLAISPYNYDYDMPLLGIALALLAPELSAQARLTERALLFASCWLLGGAGLFSVFVLIDDQPHHELDLIAAGTIGLVGVIAVTWRVLWRCHRTETAVSPSMTAAEAA